MNLKSIFTALLCISLTSLIAQQKNFIDQPYIEVTGTAEMEVSPDEIYLSITLNEKDFKGSEDLEKKEKEMVKALKAIGINVQESLVVKDMASIFKDSWIKSSEIKEKKVFELMVSTAKKAAEVMQSLEKIEISNISIARIDHSELESYKEEVKVLAIKAAKKKANYLTEAIDQKITKALYIEEQSNKARWRPSNSAYGYGYENVNFARSKTEGSGVEIEFDKIKLGATFLVKFGLE